MSSMHLFQNSFWLSLSYLTILRPIAIVFLLFRFHDKLTLHFIDINECRENPSVCSNEGRCVNTIGGYYCVTGVNRGGSCMLSCYRGLL